MLIVGLTGGIATGKSTVSKRLRDHHHIVIVDADAVAHEVVEPGKPAYNEIVKQFGSVTPDLVLPDGKLNRPALGRTVFGNPDRLRVLNSIVHPAVRKTMAWQIAKSWVQGEKIVVADVPLLFEAKLDQFVGLSVAVLCDEEIQFERLRARDPHLSEDDAHRRIASQMPLSEKRRRADCVIENDGSLEDLNAKVDAVVADIMPSEMRTWAQRVPPIGLGYALWAYLFPVRSNM